MLSFHGLVLMGSVSTVCLDQKRFNKSWIWKMDNFSFRPPWRFTPTEPRKRIASFQPENSRKEVLKQLKFLERYTYLVALKWSFVNYCLYEVGRQLNVELLLVLVKESLSIFVLLKLFSRRNSFFLLAS